MAAPEEGSTIIPARRVDTMENAGKIRSTEYAKAAQWSRRLEEMSLTEENGEGQAAERRIRWQRGGLGLRTGAERRRLRRKRGGKDDEDRQARQPGPEKGSTWWSSGDGVEVPGTDDGMIDQPSF